MNKNTSSIYCIIHGSAVVFLVIRFTQLKFQSCIARPCIGVDPAPYKRKSSGYARPVVRHVYMHYLLCDYFYTLLYMLNRELNVFINSMVQELQWLQRPWPVHNLPALKTLDNFETVATQVGAQFTFDVIQRLLATVISCCSE